MKIVYTNTDEAPALDGLPAADVVTMARGRATSLGIGPGDRVLSTLTWCGDGLVDGLLAVLAAGASLVQVANADDAALDRIAEQPSLVFDRRLSLSGWQKAEVAMRALVGTSASGSPSGSARAAPRCSAAGPSGSS